MRSVFSTIAPPWFTSAKHGFRVIDLAEMLCNLMADRIPAISHTEELIVATARSIEGHTLRYGGLHASNPDRRASLLYVPDSAVVLGRAPGAGARGRRRRVGATDIQQHMPNIARLNFVDGIVIGGTVSLGAADDPDIGRRGVDPLDITRQCAGPSWRDYCLHMSSIGSM